MKRFFETNDSYGPLIGRLVVAAVMFPHGAQKVLGWFGGHGFNGTMQFFTQTMHIPAPLAFLAILAEFAAPIALVFGFLTRLSALGIGVNILVAAVLGGHLQHGFFMNWFGNQKGQGVEYHILMAGLAAVLVIQGAGRFAVDSLIANRIAENKSEPEVSGRTAHAH